MNAPRIFFTVAVAALLAVPQIANAACNKNFTLINRSSSLSVTRFYASPHDTDDWEDNILGKDTVEPGNKTDIDMSDDKRADRTYDVLAVLSDGTKLKRANIDLCKIISINVYDGRIKYSIPVEY